MQAVAERAIFGMNASMMALGQRQHGQQGLLSNQSELAIDAIRAQQGSTPGWQHPAQSVLPMSTVEGPQGPVQDMHAHSAAVVIVRSFNT